MLNKQIYNNRDNSGNLYINESNLQNIGLYVTDDFDQPCTTKRETVDLTDDDFYDENCPPPLIKTRVAPIRTFRTPKGTALVANGITSIQIISDEYISSDLMQAFGSSKPPEASIVLTDNRKNVLSKEKPFWEQEQLHKRYKPSTSKEYHAVIVQEPEPKIPRPPNAFMIFANQWRKKVANKFNNESNKDISVRLGQMWKNLDKTRKEEYFAMARKADAEHKMKYPDYVYNPKEARLRKALRDSWKDKSKRSSNGQIRSTGGKSLTNNWSSPPITQNRTLLPMPSLSNMTFSMAADGYSMMETPAWSNSWYPYRHNPVPYLVPQFSESFTGESIGNCPDRMYHQPIQQSGMRSSVIGPSRSPFNEHTEPEANKGPLSQLQELANVFSSPAPCNRNQDNDVKEVSPTENNEMKFSNNSTKLEVESTVLNNDSDSGYVTDHPQQKETALDNNEFNSENVSKTTGVSDVLMTENNAGESFMETFENNAGESNYINMDDVFLDCNFLSNEKNFESNSSLDNADQGKNVLPGFQQAFGSTEIGRFSRNDFFTNPPPETTPEKVSNDNQVESPIDSDYQPVKKTRTKAVRKPRKVKNSIKKTEENDVKRNINSPDDCYYERQNGCVRKGRKTLNNDKSDIYNRHDSVMSEQTTYPPPFGYPSSLPTYGNQSLPGYRDEPPPPPPRPPPPYPLPRNQPYQGADHSYGNQYLRPDSIFSHPYENYQHRYGYPHPEYPENGYPPPYMRNNYPGYSNYEYPYFRPFGFHLDYGESWSNSSSNWSGQGWMPGQQPPYNSWTSSNMFPFMRLDY